jgi:hypothetical protein
LPSTRAQAGGGAAEWVKDGQMRFLENQKISDYTDYEAITRITNTLKNKEKSLPTGRQV